MKSDALKIDITEEEQTLDRQKDHHNVRAQKGSFSVRGRQTDFMLLCEKNRYKRSSLHRDALKAITWNACINTYSSGGTESRSRRTTTPAQCFQISRVPRNN